MAQKSEAERITRLGFYIGTMILLGWLAWLILRPLIAEIAWAIVFAICLDPLRIRLARLGPSRAAAILTLALALLVLLPAVFIAVAIVAEAKPAIVYFEKQMQTGGATEGGLHEVWAWAQSQAPFIPAEEEVAAKIAESAGAVAQFISRQAANLVRSALSFIVSLLLTVMFVFFFLRDTASHVAMLRRTLPFSAEQNERLLTLGRELIFASVTATFVIAIIQGFIGGVTFAALGIDGAVLWGAVMAVLSLIPLVGSAIVWVPAAIWLALSGSIAKGLILVGIGVLGIGTVNNLVRPIFLSGKAQMNTLVLIISLLGGVSAFGFIGIVLGPLVAAVLTALVESYHEEREAPSGK